MDEIKKTPSPIFGALKESITINADIVKAIEQKWDADSSFAPLNDKKTRRLKIKGAGLIKR